MNNWRHTWGRLLFIHASDGVTEFHMIRLRQSTWTNMTADSMTQYSITTRSTWYWHQTAWIIAAMFHPSQCRRKNGACDRNDISLQQRLNCKQFENPVHKYTSILLQSIPTVTINLLCISAYKKQTLPVQNILAKKWHTRRSRKSGRTKSRSDWVSGITNQSATELHIQQTALSMYTFT